MVDTWGYTVIGIHATSIGSHFKVNVALYSPISTPLILQLPNTVIKADMLEREREREKERVRVRRERERERERERRERVTYEVPLM